MFQDLPPKQNIGLLQQVLLSLLGFVKIFVILVYISLPLLSSGVNPIFHGHTKHIEVDYHFVREKFVRGDISIQFISIDDQIVDIFTKALPSPRFHRLSSKLLVCSNDHSFEGG
jgi:hypothetical protein